MAEERQAVAHGGSPERFCAAASEMRDRMVAVMNFIVAI